MVQLVSPGTDAVANKLAQTGPGAASWTDAAMQAREHALDGSYAGNVLVTLGDALIDNKVGHTQALARKSVTAWAPEAYTLWRIWEHDKAVVKAGGNVAVPFWKRVAEANREGMITQNGYDPMTGNKARTKIVTPGPDYTTTGMYRGLKHGGQVARLLVARHRGKAGVLTKIARPISKALNTLGATF